MNLEFALNDDTFRDSKKEKIFEGFIDEVKYRNVYCGGVEILEGCFRLEGDEKKDFKNSRMIPLLAGDYVGFTLKKQLFSSKLSNDVLLLNKYDATSGKCVAKYKLYFSGPRASPYEVHNYEKDSSNNRRFRSF